MQKQSACGGGKGSLNRTRALAAAEHGAVPAGCPCAPVAAKNVPSVSVQIAPALLFLPTMFQNFFQGNTAALLLSRYARMSLIRHCKDRGQADMPVICQSLPPLL